jgi:hypothetical protein
MIPPQLMSFLKSPKHMPVSPIKLFSHKKQNLWSWDNSLPVPEYQDLQMIGCQIDKNFVVVIISVCVCVCVCVYYFTSKANS